jgi:phage gp16-like protein
MASRFMDARRIALVRVARSRLNLDEASYRALLASVAGVSSSTELDATGFDDLMAAFRRLGFKSDWYRETGGSGGFAAATPGQVALIRNLWLDYSDRKGTPADLRTWLQRHFKVTALRFVDVATAPKVIAALRAMVARKSAARQPPEAA